MVGVLRVSSTMAGFLLVAGRKKAGWFPVGCPKQVAVLWVSLCHLACFDTIAQPNGTSFLSNSTPTPPPPPTSKWAANLSQL